MLIYLDTNIVIYEVENPTVFGAQARARLQAISVADQIAVSDLTRMECCSSPLRDINFQLLRDYDIFFARNDVNILPITPNVFRQATVVKALYDFATVDAIHVATAIEHGCQIFLTNDQRLSRCTDLTVELLI